MGLIKKKCNSPFFSPTFITDTPFCAKGSDKFTYMIYSTYFLGCLQLREASYAHNFCLAVTICLFDFSQAILFVEISQLYACNLWTTSLFRFFFAQPMRIKVLSVFQFFFSSFLQILWLNQNP